MTRSRSIRLFDRIAGIYGLLFHAQRLVSRRALRAVLRRLGLPPGSRILDIGCGPGAAVSLLAEMGQEAWAVDSSPRMVATAVRLLRRAGLQAPAARLAVGDPLEGLDFPDRRFDLVLAAYVVHGLLPPQRKLFYREARRVSRGVVLIRDFSPRPRRGPGPVASVLEALEGSDYRRFRRDGEREMREVFSVVEVLPGSPGSSWYLCRA